MTVCDDAVTVLWTVLWQAKRHSAEALDSHLLQPLTVTLNRNRNLQLCCLDGGYFVLPIACAAELQHPHPRCLVLTRCEHLAAIWRPRTAHVPSSVSLQSEQCLPSCNIPHSRRLVFTRCEHFAGGCC